MYQRQVTFSEAIESALVKNYCNFKGRASRSEYWWFVLLNVTLKFVVVGVSIFSEEVGTILSYGVSLALFLPGLGLSVRRLHDIGKSGWWLLPLLVFALFVGSIASAYSLSSHLSEMVLIVAMVGILLLLACLVLLIVWFCRDSDRGDNKYGPEPNVVE